LLEGGLISGLCVWRVTHLLHAEAGPFDLAARLRAKAGGGFWGQALDCFYCCSLWVALPVAALTAESVWRFVLLWPALSGAACLLEQATARPVFYEDPKE
jgi:hypothetical protein